MNKKIIASMLVFILFIIGGIVLNGCAKKLEESSRTTKYWTCGMHPSVRVSDAEYRRGKTNCPICNMPLIPVEEETTSTVHSPQSTVQDMEYYGCGVKEV